MFASLLLDSSFYFDPLLVLRSVCQVLCSSLSIVTSSWATHLRMRPNLLIPLSQTIIRTKKFWIGNGGDGSLHGALKVKLQMYSRHRAARQLMGNATKVD
jgi:hypothetical protein